MTEPASAPTPFAEPQGVPPGRFCDASGRHGACKSPGRVDFALHTGLRLRVRSEARNGHSRLALAGLSAPAVAATSTIEAGLLAQDLVLGSLVPGQDLLAGQGRPVRVFSDDDLAALLPRCFVRDQFVALAHWSRPGSATVDRAHVHRKIYPVVL